MGYRIVDPLRANLFIALRGLALMSMIASVGCMAPKQGKQMPPKGVGKRINVLTWHNDNSLTGLNPNESILTPANVNAIDFGQLFSYPVDGYVYAQPLYMSGVSIRGLGTRNVVFVATEHDSVYAFDADGAAPGLLWHRTFIDPDAGITTVPTSDIISRDIVPEIGITGTPVIDGSTGILYVAPKTKEKVGGVHHYVQRLHALDVATGLDVRSPVTVGDTTFVKGVYTNMTPIFVSGTGDGSQNGVVKFNAMRQMNRTALTLSGDRVYVTFASHGDNRPYHGWVAAYHKKTLDLETFFNAAPNGRWGGVWMAGSGLGVDSESNLYFATGNGTFSIVPPEDCGSWGAEGNLSWCNPAYGDSVVKLSARLEAADFFAPFNQRELERVDQDLGSGGLVLLPDQPGSRPHLMVQTGKQGRIYLIDRDDMGQYQRCGPVCDDVLQVVDNAVMAIHSAPALFDNRVYYHASGDVLKAFQLANGRLQTPPDRSNIRFGFPGSTPSISASGTSHGIVWALQNDTYGSGGPSVLHAYDAVNLPNELYNSQRMGLRDQAGRATKFTVPTIANGKVYVGTGTHLNVYGLFPENKVPPQTAPSDLAAKSPSPSQVTLSWKNRAPNATGIKIERSSDGKNFTPINTVGREASTFTDNGLTPRTVYFYRLQATNQAGDSNYSKVASGRTRVQAPALIGDTCVGVIHLAWTGTADDHYEVDRSVDGISFTKIGSVSATTTSFQDSDVTFGRYIYRVRAFTVDNDSSPSNTITVTLGPVHIDHSQGFDRHAELQENGAARFTGEGVASLNNLDDQRGSFFTTQRVDIRRFSTSFTIRLHEGTDPRGEGLTFTVQGNEPTALGPNAGGLAYGPDRPGTGAERGIRNSVAIKFDLKDNAGEGPNSTGLFTDGRSPTVRSPSLPSEIPDRTVDLRGTGINLQSQSVKRVDLVYDGAILTETISDLSDPKNPVTFKTSYMVDIPHFVGADTAFVGFTGATGGEWSIQDILTWKFDEGDGNGLPPRRPVTLRVSRVDRFDADRSDITLGWLCNAYRDVQGFSIERSSDGAEFKEITRIEGPTHGFTDKGLAGGTYFYHARAFHAKLESAPSNVDSVLIGGGDHPTVVDHSKGFASHDDLTVNGNATYAGTSLRLTAAEQRQSGSVFLNSRVPIQSFNTHFSFLIRPTSADGMTFTIQGNSPAEIGLRGEGLGYEQIRNSLAIKFDLSNNEDEGPNSTGVFTDGRRPTVRGLGLPVDVPDITLDLRNTEINLRSGHVFDVDIKYDGNVLSVTITDTFTLASVTQTYAVDVARFVGGNVAYVGFTGATGGSMANPEIRTWTFEAKP